MSDYGYNPDYDTTQDGKDLPLMPYAGTSGHSGTTTSKARVDKEDHDGTTGKRQRQVLDEVTDHMAYGLTVKELREILELHHGQVSSALSILHKEGLLSRLSEARDRCKVYVSNDYVQGREIEPYAARDAKVEVSWRDWRGRFHQEQVSPSLKEHLDRMVGFSEVEGDAR